MQVSNLDYTYAAIPAQLNCDDCSKVYEENDSNDDGQLTVDEIGDATSLSISNSIPKESIETQELQDDLVNVFENLKNNKIDQNDFNDFLKDIGIKIEDEFNNKEHLVKEEKQKEENEKENINELLNSELETEDFKKEEENLLKLTSALFEINREKNNTKLSSYASMMEQVNKQTQSSSINEKLQAYTQNLRN